MLPEEFVEQWDANKDGALIKFHAQDLIRINFSEDVKNFLTIGGLPVSPAPYLEFTSSQSLLRPLTTVFTVPVALQKYWYLGSTSSGNPICITEKKENIVFLNHGDTYNEGFINTSISQFAESLLAYSKMIDQAIEMNGEDAFIDNEIPVTVIDWLQTELRRIDAKSVEKGSFWFTEIENLYE